MDRIWHFMAERGLDLADRIETTIRSRVERLAEFPPMGRSMPRLGIREVLIPDIQYRIGYEVRDEGILIVAIRSTRENR